VLTSDAGAALLTGVALLPSAGAAVLPNKTAASAINPLYSDVNVALYPQPCLSLRLSLQHVQAATYRLCLDGHRRSAVCRRNMVTARPSGGTK